MGALVSILGILTGLGGPIRDIVRSNNDLSQARLRAETDQEKSKIDAEVKENNARKAVLIAEAGNRIAGAINAIVRGYIAVGPATYIFKYYFWDKAIGAWAGCAGLDRTMASLKLLGKATEAAELAVRCATFRTDGLTVQMAAVMTAVVAFYFVYDMTARYRKR